MPSVNKIIQPIDLQRLTKKLISTLQKLEGKNGNIHLNKKQIELIGKNNDHETKEIVSQILSNTQNPSIDIAYKSKSNYTIAGLRLKDGKNVVGAGAISIANPNFKNAIVKYRASLGKEAELAYANGFLNIGVSGNNRDLSKNFNRGITSYDAIGKSAEHHIKFNKEKLLGILSKSKSQFLKQLFEEFNICQLELQSKINSINRNIRRMLRLNAQDIEQSFVQSTNKNHHYGKHKIKRYLYHLTSEENYQKILREGKLRITDDYYFSKDGVYMFELQNLLKRWRYSKNWTEHERNTNLSLSLLHHVSKCDNKIVCLRIPTATLDHDLLKIRSQNRLLKKRSTIPKEILPEIRKHKTKGAPAKDAGHYKQRKEAIEYIYTEDIPIENIKLIGKADIRSEDIIYDYCDYDIFPPEKEQNSAVARVLKNLFRNQPEEKAVKRSV